MGFDQYSVKGPKMIIGNLSHLVVKVKYVFVVSRMVTPCKGPFAQLAHAEYHRSMGCSLAIKAKNVNPG